MKKVVSSLVCAAVALLLSSGTHISHAQEVVVENDAGIGARAMGMGGAQIAKTLRIPATNDPFLKPFEQMSLQDKLALLKGTDLPDVDAPRHIPRPRLRGLPALVAVSHPLSQQLRPVTIRNAMPGEIELPMGGPAALVGPQPLMQVYVKVPTVSSSDKPMILSVPEQAGVKEESEAVTPQEPIEQPAALKSERRILRIVVVVRNDSLWQISMDNYGTFSNDILAAIQDANPSIKDPDRIYVGQEIKLPELRTYEAYEGKTVKVKTNDNLFRIAMRAYGIVNKRVYEEIQKANPRVKNLDFIMTGQKIILPTISDIPFREDRA